MKAETWLPVQGYEGLYSVSDRGNVMSMNYANTGMLKLLTLGKRGNYLKVDLYRDRVKKTFAVHQLVAVAFMGPSNGLQVNHISGIGSDNRAENLEYCTGSQNMKHAFATGLQSNKGQNHSRTKFTDEDVLNIRSRYAHGEKQSDLAKEFGVYGSAISRIVTGKRWPHLELVKKVG